MSWKAVGWAMGQELPAMQKILLLVLADHHNDDTGQCNPSTKRLAWKCGMTRQSVNNQLRRLEQVALVVTEKRYHDDGSAMSSQYHLACGFEGDTVNNVVNPVNVVYNPGKTSLHKPVIEPIKEPNPQETSEIEISSVSYPHSKWLQILSSDKRWKTPKNGWVSDVEERFASVDLIFEAHKFLAWLDTPKGQKRKNLATTWMNWLGNANNKPAATPPAPDVEEDWVKRNRIAEERFQRDLDADPEFRAAWEKINAERAANENAQTN